MQFLLSLLWVQVHFFYFCSLASSVSRPIMAICRLSRYSFLLKKFQETGNVVKLNFVYSIMSIALAILFILKASTNLGWNKCDNYFVSNLNSYQHLRITQHTPDPSTLFSLFDAVLKCKPFTQYFHIHKLCCWLHGEKLPYSLWQRRLHVESYLVIK